MAGETTGRVDVTTKHTIRKKEIPGEPGTSGAPGAASEEISPPESVSTTPPASVARVRIGKGATVNLGRMEFYRIDVSVEVPCRAIPKSIETALDFCDEIADARLEHEIELARSQAAKGGKE